MNNGTVLTQIILIIWTILIIAKIMIMMMILTYLMEYSLIVKPLSRACWRILLLNSSLPVK